MNLSCIAHLCPDFQPCFISLYVEIMKGGEAVRHAVEIYDREEIKTFGRPPHLSNGTSPAI